MIHPLLELVQSVKVLLGRNIVLASIRFLPVGGSLDSQPPFV